VREHDLYDIITEFRRKNARASISETTFLEPYVTAHAAQDVPSGSRMVSDVVVKATPSLSSVPSAPRGQPSEAGA
jgi:hypothetical protein